MNKLIYSLCVSSLALAVGAQAADYDNTTTQPRRKTQTTTTTPTTQSSVSTNKSVNVRRNTNGTRFQQRTYNNTTLNTTGRHQNRYRNYNSNVAVSGQRDVDQTRVRTRRNFDVNNSGNVTVNRTRNFNRTGRNFDVNRQQNLAVNRQRNVTITNNWNGSRFSGQQYAAFRNYHRQWHDRNWWTSHYNRIIFVSGGWYFWNSGYWYPAWGYDPGYSYPYDGPIYGYNSLTPDQVVVSVQEQLSRDGYYAGPIDGDMGPMTRQAIADFQADHGLAVTASVDRPTLATLGLV